MMALCGILFRLFILANVVGLMPSTIARSLSLSLPMICLSRLIICLKVCIGDCIGIFGDRWKVWQIDPNKEGLRHFHPIVDRLKLVYGHRVVLFQGLLWFLFKSQKAFRLHFVGYTIVLWLLSHSPSSLKASLIYAISLISSKMCFCSSWAR